MFLCLSAAWVEFENDVIDQDQLFEKFFADGRQFDGQALVEHMVRTTHPAPQPIPAALPAAHAGADCASPFPG
jgi:hypothetical protein